MNYSFGIYPTYLLLFHQEPVSCCMIDTILITLTFLNIKTNRMKRIILFAFLVTTVLVSQASVISNSKNGHNPGFSIGKSTLEKFNKIEISKSLGNVNSAENCTVTMKGSINGGVFTVEVSCSATASTCDQAASKATNCLSTAIRKARLALS